MYTDTHGCQILSGRVLSNGQMVLKMWDMVDMDVKFKGLQFKYNLDPKAGPLACLK